MFTIVTPSEHRRTEYPGEPGHFVTDLLGRRQGSVHLSAQLHGLAPGAAVTARRGLFEQSVFMLTGTAILDRPGESFRLGPDDHAFIERVGAYGWRNDSSAVAEWLSVRAPLPPTCPVDGPSEWAAELVVAPAIRPVREGAVDTPLVGHLEIGDFRPVGRAEMPGYRGPNLRGFSARHLTDHQNGARHHSFFGLRLPTPVDVDAAALTVRMHYHPFEELYFLRQGVVVAQVDGSRIELAPGDLLWCGVGTPHGFVAAGATAGYWLEAQAPMPPIADAFLYPSDWDGHRPVGGPEPG